MKVLKCVWGLALFAVLVVVVQLADPSQDSPGAIFQRLPDVSLTSLAEAEWAAGRTESALLLLDYAIDNDLADKTRATQTRQQIFAQLAAENTALSRIQATGWAATLAGGNSFESLAGSTVADATLYGELAELARQGGLDAKPDEFTTALNNVRPMATVFPPADGALTLTKAAHLAGALNESLTRQLRQMLALVQADPRSALAVEKFKENFMPVLELAKRCRTWGEFQTILRQADSPDQLKVLTKIVSVAPAPGKRLSQTLTVVQRDGRSSVAACLDAVMRQGPPTLDALYASIRKGPGGVKFVLEHPGVTAATLERAALARQAGLESLQEQYQLARNHYGPVVAATKYLAIAILCGLLVLVVVPGSYLEKLIARPDGSPARSKAGPLHFLLSALAVGLVLSGLLYLLTQAVRPPVEPGAVSSLAGESGAAGIVARGDSAFLSGVVVLLSLVIHAMVWFFVRGKLREVEDDETSSAALRLKRLENLDVFLDLPLFTGLALTVIAFILITLDAGMSRHFAYTSTVVGILSAVSLRVRYLYPLKERLIQRTAS